jgi:hypothetical protein
VATAKNILMKAVMYLNKLLGGGQNGGCLPPFWLHLCVDTIHIDFLGSVLSLWHVEGKEASKEVRGGER